MYHLSQDYPRAIAKLDHAISQGKLEDDEGVVYTSLGVLGQAFLKLARTSGAVQVLHEIEQMVLSRAPFVVGDETLSLEAARGQGLELSTVKRVASVLAPICRDAEFADRLKALAEDAR